MCPKDVDGMANSVDTDQTAPSEVLRPGFTLFSQNYLSEHLESLRLYVS